MEKLNIEPKINNGTRQKLIDEGLIASEETVSNDEFNALVDKTNELVEAVNAGAPITAFNFLENVPTYEDLPVSGNQVNDGYGVLEDGLIYVWNGLSFQSKGNGMDLGLKPSGKVEEGNDFAVSGNEVLDYFEKNSLPLEKSYNLIDKNKILKGNFGLTGGFNSTSLNLSIFNIPVKSEVFYGFVGGNLINNFARFCWLDSNNNILRIDPGYDYSIFPVRVKSPKLASSVNMTLSYNGSGYLDPTDNAIANQAMLVELAELNSPIPDYMPFDYIGLSSKKIVDLDQSINENINSNSKIIQAQKEIEFLLSDYEEVYLFDGVKSNKDLDKTYILSLPGDFIEITCQAEITGLNGLNLIGLKNTNRSLIGFFNLDTFWLRDINSDSNTLNWKINVNLQDYNIFKVLINSEGAWELFVNGVSQGMKSYTAPLHINNVGKSYSSLFFKGKIKGLSIRSQAIEYFNVELNSPTISTIHEKNSNDDAGKTPNVFYRYDPIGFQGRESLIVYVKQGDSNHYSRFEYNRVYDMNELIYLDYFRIYGAYLSIYSNGIMSDTNHSVLVSAESEFTMLQLGKVDHVGSYHGDELFTSRKFLPNGVDLLDYSQKINLTPCDFFEVEIISTMHDVANSTDPTIPIEGHPVIAKHIKRTTFLDSGYQCENVVKFETPQQMIRAYTGLICISKNYATKVRDNYGNYAIANKGDNSRSISSEYANVLLGEGKLGSSIISSEVIAVHKPGNKNCEDLYKEFSKQWVQDRTNDSKYYRILGFDNSNYIDVEVGEIWHLKSKLQVFAKQI